jgi:sugar phosphate isomerase/epimerase
MTAGEEDGVKIAVIADEVSGDLETALELTRMWGADAIELRRAGDRRYPDVSDYWKRRVPEFVREYGLPVAAISPGLFKVPVPGTPAPFHFHRGQDIEQWEREQAIERQFDFHVNTLLPASIEAAKQLGTSKIICFDFEWHDAPSKEIVQVMRDAAQRVAAEGLMLVIEVDIHRSAPTADLVRQVNHPGLQINWDPGNAYRAGDDVPFPDGYEHVRPFVRHVHFKDAKTDENGKRIWTLDGVIDWSGQIAALIADGFDGYVSVEPHLRPNIEACTRTLARIRQCISEASLRPPVAAGD